MSKLYFSQPYRSQSIISSLTAADLNDHNVEDCDTQDEVAYGPRYLSLARQVCTIFRSMCIRL